ANQPVVGVGFGAGPQLVSFAPPVLQRNPEFGVSGDALLEALRLSFPADVKAVQRRSNYRVRVPEDGELRIRMWRIPEHFVLRDKPVASQELLARIRDISIGGIGVSLLPKGEEQPKVLSGERLRLTLRYK